ncbi:MauE/DoxX family redox-associated membrane protein [Pseudomonas sp. N040]|uniref:MauE/DoxX family redox-associated membrane protein n=1 Tax=Pseudomonas sp. N040 TaxID=2785325 RepID=UPI0018A31029|nr:MauE/DoxX family redox-associated membrane protein [Pseudomonas sp. N040]MBF7729800.1 methylamine utilization protein MauE [Pseudomonas sp. N040]MBW7013442.1 methylamine utilization protein MauE [Pseudomonas sp. N040]
MVIGLLTDPVWVTASSLGLVLLLGAAALHKLRDRGGFAQVLQNYRLLPGGLEKPLTLLLAVLELAAAAALLLPSWRAPAALLAAALLLLYAGVMALSLLQGRRIADCGCHVGEQRQAVSPPLVWRNLLLALLALNLLQAPGGRVLGLYDGVVIGCLLLCGCAFYLLANILIANHHSARELSL